MTENPVQDQPEPRAPQPAPASPATVTAGSPSSSAAVRPPEREAPPAAFEVEGLSMWYGKKQALFDITTSIPSKTITAIIGPSGCGKSTFLRCLNRMHELVPQARHRGERTPLRREPLRPEQRPGLRPPPRRHGLSEIESVPDHVDRRERRRRPPAQRGAQPLCAERTHGKGPPHGRPVG